MAMEDLYKYVLSSSPTWASTTTNTITSSSYLEVLARQRAQAVDVYNEFLYQFYGSPLSPQNTEPAPKNTLKLIKKSIRQINAEAVGKEAQGRIEDKILRLLEVGADAQAAVLEAELKVRQKLMRLKEWDYKVLPADEIKKYENANRNWDGQGGRVIVHIDPLQAYIGNPESGEAKDRIIPDAVLDKLDEAKERKLFDSFAVLWVEKVKDPLLLGCIDGCKDYFLVAVWGNDVKFEDIVKEK
jgi:hypothetical protein